MCLARIYGRKHGSEEKTVIAESVAMIIPEGEKIHLYSLFGEETVVEGVLEQMDLERNTVQIALS